MVILHWANLKNTLENLFQILLYYLNLLKMDSGVLKRKLSKTVGDLVWYLKENALHV